MDLESQQYFVLVRQIADDPPKWQGQHLYQRGRGQDFLVLRPLRVLEHIDDFELVLSFELVLTKSLEIRDTTANTKFPIANPHQGKFRTEVSRYLSNAQYGRPLDVFLGLRNMLMAWQLLAKANGLP